MKLLNGLRFKMLERKRLANYIIYAVGEIILVVIGILIALTINDWNQKRANQLELDRIVEVIKTDLKNDLQETNAMINASKEKHKLIVNVLYNPKFQDSIRNCVDCKYILTEAYISNFNTKGIELLSNYNKNEKGLNKYVDSILNFYEQYSREEFQIKNKIILDEVVDNMKYLRDNYDWFTDYYIGSVCEEDCLNYFESPNYINRLTYYEALYYDDFLLQVENYRKDIKDILDYLN